MKNVMNSKRRLSLITAMAVITGSLLQPELATAQPEHRPPPHHKGHMMKLIEGMDVDKNGNLSKAEIDSVQKQRFTDMDSNQDGSVNIDEFEKKWIARQRNRMVDSFQRLDENGDGKVVRDEFDAPLDKFMERRDKDNNGELSSAELQRGGERKRRYKTEFMPNSGRGASGESFGY